MRRELAFLAAVAAIPSAAFAQNVPAIQAQSTAVASVNTGQSTSAGQHQTPPAGWPPALPMTSPSAPLDHKERTAANMSAQWRNKADRPVRDANGVLRWIYGVSQARIVCAPLQACDIELKPGEVINNILIGDSTYWRHYEGISGGPEGRTTHVTLQVLDAGRTSSLMIFTDQHTYNIKLVSTQAAYTPLTGFVYPQAQQDEQASWQNYKLAAAGHGGLSAPSYGVDAAHIEPLEIKGDRPSWRPKFAYTDGRKTYIEFPGEMQFSDSPTLLGVNGDGGLFSGPTTRRVIYRWEGRRIVADAVMDKMELILGVGGDQEKVLIVRHF
jgi:type IV secretion system protein TrbG